MAKPKVESRRTAIQIAVPKTGYVAGSGAETEYEILTVTASDDSDGDPLKTDIFYCDWTNFFGTVAIQLEQQSIPKPARVRMTYVKEVYDALSNKLARIYKNANPDDAYVLNSPVDNIGNENKTLEFNVKRNEVV